MYLNTSTTLEFWFNPFLLIGSLVSKSYSDYSTSDSSRFFDSRLLSDGGT